MRFQRVEVPGRAEDPASADLRAEIAAWIDSDAFCALLDEFNGPSPNDDDLRERLQALDDFSAQTWDFRRNKERNLISPDAVTGAVEATVLDAAQALGLVAPEPPRFDAYDHVLVLGGLVRACVWRPEYAALLMRDGLDARSFTALTAFRELGGDEPQLLAALGLPERGSEHEVMIDGVVRAFGVDHLDVARASEAGTPANERFLVATASSAAGTSLDVVVAPSSDPGSRRANTADTYAYWANQVGHPGPGARLLLVTSAIYVPFQHADAIRILGLPFGCSVDTVGLDPDRINDHGVPQVFSGAHYLQELRSALRSFRALEAELPLI